MGLQTIYPLPPPPDPWGELVEQVFYVDRHFHEFRIETYFAVIKQEKIATVAKGNAPPLEYDRWGKLFDHYLRSEAKGAVFEDSDWNIETYRTLYLEPAEDLFALALPRQNSDKSVFQVMAEDMRDFLDRESHISRPAYFDGIVMFHGIDHTNGLDQIAFGINALASTHENADDLNLPLAVERLIELQQWSMVTQDIARHLRDHPFVKGHVSQYVAELRNQRPLSSSYDQAFVDDKIAADLLTLQAGERLNEIQDLLNKNRIFNHSVNAKQIEYEQGKVNFNVLPRLLEFVNEKHLAAKAALDMLRSHSLILSDVLRDAVNVEIGNANIGIQKAVVRLTYIGIAIAIIALTTSFIPDAAKVDISSWVLGRFNIKLSINAVE